MTTVEENEEEWEWLIAHQSAPWSIAAVGANGLHKISALEWKHALQDPAHEAAFRAQLKQYESRFRDGEQYAVFAALTFCVMWCRPLPSWLSKELWLAYRLYSAGKLRSWDDVFGKSFPGKRRKGISTQQKALSVWAMVRQLHEVAGVNLDEAFEQVGETCRFSAATAKNLYYKVQRRSAAVTVAKKVANQSSTKSLPKRDSLIMRKK
jgi:hypothetical protein